MINRPRFATVSSKLLSAASLACALFLGICPALRAQSTTIKYTEFAKVVKNNAALFTLEYGIRSPYDGEVRWRFTNKSNTTIYDVSINDKTYTLNDDKTVKCPGEEITSKLAPMDSKTSQPDPVNSDENKGSFSDKNSNRVKEINIKGPMIKIAKEKGGEQLSWDTFGTVVTQ